MTDETLSDLLNRAATLVPDSNAPIAGLLREGKRVRRRRTRTAIAAACAAVLVAAGVTTLGVTSGHHATTLISPASPPAPPAGTKWVGVGHTVFAVPAGWPVWPELYCGPRDGHDYVSILRADVTVGCTPQFHDALGRQLSLTVDAAGTVTVDNRAVAATRTELPNGWLAVPRALPAEGAGSPTVAEETQALEDAGFHVQVEQVPWWGNDTGPQLTTDPETGTPARVGSTVTVQVHLASLATSGLSGQLRWAGGVMIDRHPAHPGLIHVLGNGFDEYVPTDVKGRWNVALPPGSYTVRATSPGFGSSTGTPDACQADRPSLVSKDQTTTTNVYCQRK